MAEEITSTLGLDATKLFTELNRMQQVLNGYADVVVRASNATSTFNKSGAEADRQAARLASSLSSIEAAARRAGTELKGLSPAAASFFKESQQQTNVSSSLAKQFQEASALAQSYDQLSAARELDAKAANLQAQATAKVALQQAAAQRAAEAQAQRSRDPLNKITPGQGVLGAERRAAAELNERAAFFQKVQDRINERQTFLRNNLRQTEVALRNVFRPEPIKQFTDAVEESGKKGAEAGQSILISWQSVVRIFTIQVLHRIVAQFTSALIEGTNAAKEFQVSVAEIQTISRGLNLNFDQLSARLIAVSREFGTPLKVVTEGIYQTLSNQVGDAADAFSFFASAQRFGIASLTDADSSVNLLSSVLNSYSLSVAQADTVSGKLFKTIELGRIRGEEFANTFGRVAVLSAQLGVSLDEVLASIATLTVQGLRYNEAFTLVTNTQQKLISPSDALKRVFSQLGVASAEAGIQAFGFQGFLEKLTDQAGDTASEIGVLFNRVRAVRGVLGLTNQQGDRFNKVLQEIQNSGVKEVNKAFDTIFQTDAKQFEREINNISLLFTEVFGGKILSTLNTVFGVFGGGVQALKAFGLAATAAGAAYVLASTGIISGTVAMVSVFGIAETALFGFQTALAATGAFLVSPAGLAIIAAGATLALVTAYNKLTPAVQDVADAFRKQVEVEGRATALTEVQRREITKKSETEILSNTQKFFFEKQRLYEEDAQKALEIQDVAFGGIADQIKQRASLVSSFAEKLNETFNKARRSAHDLQIELEGIGNNLDAFNFERRIKDLTPQRQALANIRRSEEQIAAINRALNKGDIERAKTLQQIAEESAKAALSSADEVKNRGLVRRAEEAVRDTFKSAADIKNKEIANNKQQVELAGRLKDQETDRANRIKNLIEQFSKFKAISDKLVIDPEFDPAKARTELDRITTKLAEELTASAANAKLFARVSVEFNLDGVAQQIAEKFRDPVTSARIDLTPLVDINLNKIIDKLSTQARTLTESQVAGLKGFGIAPDFRGFRKTQDEITKVPKDLDQAAKSSQDLILAQTQLKLRMVDSAEQAGNLSEQLDRLTNRSVVALKVAGTGDNLFTNVFDNLGRLSRFLGLTSESQQTLSNDIASSVKTFNAAINTGDAATAATVLQRIDAQVKDLGRSGFPEAAATGTKLVESLQKIVEQASVVENLKVSAETLTPLENRVNSLQGAFEVNAEEAAALGPASTQGVDQAETAHARLMRLIQEETAEYKERNNQAARIPAGGGASPARAFGGAVFNLGMIHRAFGGFARGTDSVMTALSVGESVNTVAATRQFFPQIQAMNAGVKPVFRETGGIVNNVGDINVTVNESKNGRVTGREVTRALNREFRRNTTKLRGL